MLADWLIGVHYIDVDCVIHPGNGVWFAGGTTYVRGQIVPQAFRVTGGYTAFLVPYNTPINTPHILVQGGTLDIHVTSTINAIHISGGILASSSSG